MLAGKHCRSVQFCMSEIRNINSSSVLFLALIEINCTNLPSSPLHAMSRGDICVPCCTESFQQCACCPTIGLNRKYYKDPAPRRYCDDVQPAPINACAMLSKRDGQPPTQTPGVACDKPPSQPEFASISSANLSSSFLQKLFRLVNFTC